MPQISSSPEIAKFQVQQQVSTSVAKKALDNAKQQGDAVNQLLASAANIGRSEGKGSSLDRSV